MDKHCKSCNTTKPISEFNKKGHGKYQGKCRPCQKEYYKNYYTNCDKELTRLRKKNAERRAYINSVVNAHKDKPCTDCGIKYPHYVMDFDHLENKEFNIANSKFKLPLKSVLAEIAKCEVVCSNCHRERTYQRLQSSVV